MQLTTRQVISTWRVTRPSPQYRAWLKPWYFFCSANLRSMVGRSRLIENRLDPSRPPQEEWSRMVGRLWDGT